MMLFIATRFQVCAPFANFLAYAHLDHAYRRRMALVELHITSAVLGILTRALHPDEYADHRHEQHSGG
ncbi:hypothetical protein O9H85_35120 [Paenibacillus filicis]|uniref:Uncharacterized protein n=1 Tax=Paenibacillus gyeongsangnamensis TaxID=3388067 RepID=A0ABT4QKU0_9BACL|nr:hypothetical protein [Paenibacillus filicis]MCZ8517482.1 hypothetical protein [Paenibacillus filicis]